ncbi:MAG: sterol desaturase family protein [Sporocytophaga sp.]|uniref:sterol desaturase family protein n=1 Tax=Sporocytophaga sp. TaxID=2231183 RepID=UPI001B2E01E3|nr:sterol desaturase family protein [Sporocytophaga sp.]MBO9701170.1 sterol desaturase family protein [Sporocytophaga sp.]
MNELLLSISIPVFLLAVTVEYFFSRKKNIEAYTFNSTISNLSIGVAERLSNLALTGIFYSIFTLIYNHFAIFTIKETFSSWILILFLTDFIWYWYHRFSHEVNILWAAHIVHHQSEEFNLTVSARITVFQALIRNIFWCILPLIGFPVHMVIMILIIHAAYSFFTHTRLVGKLGFLEYIFVTPSHHRVHHASNAHYLDKNYADIFIFWDKLFGTFAEEKEEPQYGLTQPLNSRSFLWQHFHQLIELMSSVKNVHGVKQKIKILLGKPETLSSELRPQLEKKFLSVKNIANNQKRYIQKKYILAQISIVILLLTALVPLYQNISGGLIFQLNALILITLINCGAIMEQKSWIFHLECLRFIIISAILSFYFPDPALISVLLNVILLLCFFFSDFKRMFLVFIYGKFFYGRAVNLSSK